MTISYKIINEGILFSANNGTHYKKWNKEDLESDKNIPFHYLTFQRLLQDEKAILLESNILIHHEVAEQLTQWEKTELQLPPNIPFQLKIKINGALTYGEHFSCTHSFQLHSRQIELTCKGCMAFVQDNVFMLPYPMYTVLTLLEEFKHDTMKKTDVRLLYWGRIVSLIKNNPLIDAGTYQNYTIYTIEHFTLNLKVDTGSANIKLLPNFITFRAENEYDEPLPYEILSIEDQNDFLQHFALSSIRQCYGIKNSKLFLTLTEPIQKALAIVKSLDNASLDEKVDFINNPYAYLKDKLQDILDESTIDSLFVETPVFLSERVKGLVVWHKQKVSYGSSSGEKWFPNDFTDEIEVNFNGKKYLFTPQRLKEFLEIAAQALNEGLHTFVFQEAHFVFNNELLVFLRAVSSLFKKKINSEEQTIAKLAPQIVDNTTVQQPIRRNTWEGEIELSNGIQLHTHQQEGIAWLQEHWRNKSEGALLADDMGLGKTLQTLSFMWWLKQQMIKGYTPHLPILIVAPTGLLANWEIEADRFFGKNAFGELIIAHSRNQSFSQAIKIHSVQHIQSRLKEAGWILTTYETMRDKISLFANEFTLFVFDEAQKIKNASALVTNNAHAIKAEMCLALSGTPIENNLLDLASIVKRLQPQKEIVLRALAEEYNYQHKESKKTVQKIDDSPRAKEDILKEMQVVLDAPPSLLLRRLKDTHWHERPQKIILEPFRDLMPELQYKQYDIVLAEVKEAQALGNSFAMLKALQQIRKISLDPLSEQERPKELLLHSARVKRLITILDEIETKGEKALIFVEFLDTQLKLRSVLSERYHIPISQINGSITGQKRQQIVDAFQNKSCGFDILILSPKAGGVGINLTAANHVIHLSRWWNPAIEDQCTDRVYRIGQQKEVKIYYPQAIHPIHQEHSFDVRLHSLLEKKRQLSHSLFTPTQPEENDSEINALCNEITSQYENK